MSKKKMEAPKTKDDAKRGESGRRGDAGHRGSTSKRNAAPKHGSDSIVTPSNLVSLLRMLLVIPLVLLFDEPRTNQLSIAALALLAYLSDLADGWLARKFGGESNLGRIIDPLADKVFITAAVLLMIDKNMIPLWFAVVVIARDVIIFAGGMYLKQRSGLIVQSNMLGKAAVVSIGVVLVAALFGSGGTNITLTLLMMVSLGLIFASLYMYGERFFTLLRKAGAKK